jgi:hypothetical protein
LRRGPIFKCFQYFELLSIASRSPHLQVIVHQNVDGKSTSTKPMSHRSQWLA